MNTLPKYSEQFDKITVAYIENKLSPLDRDFCFCGTLEDNTHKWILKETAINLTYSFVEYKRMEDALLGKLHKFGAYKIGDGWFCGGGKKMEGIEYEEALFNGMVAALEVLKQIHIKKGEVIDETPSFQKRVLQSL